MKVIALRPQAEVDLIEILSYYRSISFELGQRFQENTKSALVNLSRMTGMGAPYRSPFKNTPAFDIGESKSLKSI